MPELHLVNTPNKALPISIEQPIIETSKYVTAEQLDSTMNNIVENIVKKIEPESALTPEVRGMVKAVNEVQSLRLALKDPTSAGIEEATSTLVTSVLGNALQNITGGGQQQVQAKPLKNTLAEIAVHNLTGENSPLPQLMDALTNVLGKQKVREGYDAGMQYIDHQQKQNNLPATVLQLDENSQEDVVVYAQQMGYSDVQYAQARLIEHKNRLNQEIEEYQRVQAGGQQSVAVEKPIVQQEPMIEQEVVVQQEIVTQEPIRQEPIRQEPIVQQVQYDQTKYEQVEYEKDHIDPRYSESLESPISETAYNEEPIIKELIIEEPIVEKPILKTNKVVVLHSKPRKLTLVKDKVEQAVDGDDYKVEVDDNLNINVTYSEGNKDDEQKKLIRDNEGNKFLDDVDNILSEIGE